MRILLRTSVQAILLAMGLALVPQAKAQLFDVFGYTNHVWKYTTNNLDGTSWQQPGFSDTNWASGLGSLGFEDTAATATSLANAGAGTNTIIPLAPSGGRYTVYFRTHFSNSFPSTNVTLTFSNRIDDGAVYYLNGAEIFRLGITAAQDPVTYTTFATSTEATTLQVTNIVNPPSLEIGDNVLAVEVHQTANTSADLILAVALSGANAFAPKIDYSRSSLSNRLVQQCRSTTLSVAASGSPPPRYQWLKDGQSIPGETNATFIIANMQAGDASNYSVDVCNPLGCTNSTPDTIVSYVADQQPPSLVSAVGNEVMTNITVTFSEPIDTNNLATLNFTLFDTNTGMSLAIVGVTAPSLNTLLLQTAPRDPSHGYLLTFSGIQDRCVGNAMGFTTVPVSTFLQPLIPLTGNSLWKYEQSGTDLGTAWTSPAYNDSNWLMGAGTFDAKRTNATSPLPLCRPFIPTNNQPVRTCLTLSNTTASAQLPTYYFRKDFNFTGNPSGAILRLVSLIDDAAVVYLNGVEILRLGFGTGTIGYNTPSVRTVTEAAFETNDVPAPSLRDGLNTLAVEVHQVNLTSSDVTFGLNVRKFSPTPTPAAPPELIAQPQSLAIAPGGNANLSVVVDGDPPFKFQWHANCRSINRATNSTLTISNVSPLDVGTYSVTVENSAGCVTSWDVSVMTTNVPPPLISHTRSGPNMRLHWPVRDVLYQLQETPNFNVLPAVWNNSDEYIFQMGTNQTMTIPATGQRFFRLIAPPLRIVNQPTGRSAGVNDTVTLNVGAVGTPPFLYQWRRNGYDIPNATNPAITIDIAGPAQYGAYMVAVEDASGAVVPSRPAVLRPEGMQVVLSDSFTQRPLYTNGSGSIHGITYGSTREQGEKDHAQLPGGKSVWLKWRAPSDGIAVFDSTGSAIDTLLAAYTGTSVGALTLIDSDDDSAGRLCSRIRFNAAAGVEYSIALDGLAGAEGFFVLSWTFTPSSSTIPIIVQQPQDQVVPSNTVATFAVQAQGLPPMTTLTYQWYFNGNPISPTQSGTAPALRVGPGAGNAPALLGPYYVEVMNSAGLATRSTPAFLQFSTNPEMRFVVKPIADLLCEPTVIGPANCCGGKSLGGGSSPAKTLPPGVGLTICGLMDGLKPGCASPKIESWAWVTNSWSSTTRVHLTNIVTTASGYAQLELIPSNNIANYKITAVPAGMAANPKAGLFPAAPIPDANVVHWIGAGRTPSNAVSFSVSYTQ
jgi:hypothetical protein